VRVSIDLSDAELVWVDRAVENELFEDRDTAIRGVMEGSFGDDAATAQAYRRAYSRHPVHERYAAAGLAFLSDALRIASSRAPEHVPRND
jgi:hypothetical protein